MLYLETPAGVGFSYSMDSSYYDNVDDKMTGTSACLYEVIPHKVYCLFEYLLSTHLYDIFCFIFDE